MTPAEVLLVLNRAREQFRRELDHVNLIEAVARDQPDDASSLMMQAEQGAQP
jgi:hypothetical protein